MFPIHLNLGFRVFYFYEGLYFAIAMALGAFLGYRAFKKEGLRQLDYYNLVFTVLLSAVIGGRLSHFIFWSYETLLAKPWSIFFIWEGGISITGGLVGGFLGGYLFCRKHKADFWHHFAVISPAILFAQAAGRIGCFLNGDAHGIGTSLPWGIRFPRHGILFPVGGREMTHSTMAWHYSIRQGYEGAGELWSAPLHPAQLYEALGDVLLAAAVILLYRLIKRSFAKDFRPIFFFHSGGYALLRWALEFIRADRAALVWGGMSGLQLALLAYGLLSVVMVVLFKTKLRKSGSGSA